MHRWAISQLEEDGEEVIGRISSPQYLLLARAILLAPAAIHQRPAMPAGPAAHSPAAAAADGSGAAAAAGALREGLPAAWAWWALRVALLQQRALAGRSATLRRLLEGLAQQVGCLGALSLELWAVLCLTCRGDWICGLGVPFLSSSASAAVEEHCLCWPACCSTHPAHGRHAARCVCSAPERSGNSACRSTPGPATA